MEKKQRQYPDQPAAIIMQDSYGCCWQNKQIKSAGHDGLRWYISHSYFRQITMVSRRSEEQYAIEHNYHTTALMAAMSQIENE